MFGGGLPGDDLSLDAPLPGLPPNPKAEGQLLIVSKNLVELLACLVIAATAEWPLVRP